MAIWNTTLSSSKVIFTENDLVAEIAELDGPLSASPFYSVWADTPKNIGKWYWEIEISPSVTDNPVYIGAGIAQVGGALMPPASGQINLNIPEARSVYYSVTGSLYSGNFPFGPAIANGTNIIGFALDMDNFTLSAQVNGFDLGVMKSGLVPLTNYYPYVAIIFGRARANFGTNGFQYSIPDGFQPFDANGTVLTSAFQYQSNIINIKPGIEEVEPMFPGTGAYEIINKYKVNHSRLNGNFENPILLIDGELYEQPIIDLKNKASGRLKG